MMSATQLTGAPATELQTGTARHVSPFRDADPIDGTAAVRRATAFIMSRVSEPLSVSRIAQAAGLSIRTLYRLIQREHGVSPMVLLRQERLARARTELEAPSPSTTVTRTALHWGFQHLGRFSGEYARQFGEPPSDTLRRARRSHAGLAAAPRAPAPTAAFVGASRVGALTRPRKGIAPALHAVGHDAACMS